MPQMEIEDAGLDMTDSVEDQEASGLHLTAGKSTDISASSLLQARRFVSPRQGCLTPRRSEPLSYSLNRTTNVF